jgi:hemolysin activation/secretion protein
LFRFSVFSISAGALIGSVSTSSALAAVPPAVPEAAEANAIAQATQQQILTVESLSPSQIDAKPVMQDSSSTQDAITEPVHEITQQPDPNRERFLQPAPQPLPPKPTETQPNISTPPTEPSPTSPASEQPEVKIPVRQINVIGSTVFGDKELKPITQPLEGRTATLEELKKVSQAITQLYLDAGYLTSRAVLADQNITDGVVQIQVIEGRLEDIQIEGQKPLNPDYIRSRIRLGATTPLRVDRLEDQLRLLKADPLFESFDASLRSGKEIGQSVLVVRVKEANPFYGNLNIDNYSPPSVGSERFGVALAYRNLTGNGDELAGSYYRSTTGGSNVFDFSYRVPLNPMNGTLQLRTVLDRNKVTQAPFERLNIEGESNIYEISVRQPLIRTPRQEFALSLGFSYKDGQTFLFDRTPFPFGIGADANGVTRTSVFRFGQDYVSRDTQGAWLARSQFSLGTGLLDATINKSPIPDSRFFSWLGQVQRVQRLGNDHLLLIQGDVQLTPDSLLPSEQFVIGGGQSLRGYRQNVRSGDNGFRFSVEDRITLQRNDAGVSIFQLAPFIDLGSIWNHPDNPNKLPRQTFLASAGLGLLWEPLPRLSLRLDYAIPFIDLNDRGTNAQDNGFFFSVNYRL